MRGVRPVAGGLDRVERSESLLPPIYTPCKSPARVNRIIRLPTAFVNTPDIVKFCWLALVFLPLIVGEGFPR
jgi:hypothetical protein